MEGLNYAGPAAGVPSQICPGHRSLQAGRPFGYGPQVVNRYMLSSRTTRPTGKIVLLAPMPCRYPTPIWPGPAPGA